MSRRRSVRRSVRRVRRVQQISLTVTLLRDRQLSTHTVWRVNTQSAQTQLMLLSQVQSASCLCADTWGRTITSQTVSHVNRLVQAEPGHLQLYILPALELTTQPANKSNIQPSCKQHHHTQTDINDSPDSFSVISQMWIINSSWQDYFRCNWHSQVYLFVFLLTF